VADVAETTGQIRLESGLDGLEEWSAAAGQAEQNAVYKALFSIVDGSVFRTYVTAGDVREPDEFFILVRDELVLKVRLQYPDAFGIVYIGPARDAPGYGLGIGRAG
jgi:Family of unknown function (DUF6235)